MEYNLRSFIEKLTHVENYRQILTHNHLIPPQEARYQDIFQTLHLALQEVLREEGIYSFYSHQAEAIRRIQKGQNVLVGTPTASGKTLIYNVPVFQTVLNDPTTRSLFIFPLKALEQDQLKVIRNLSSRLENSVVADIYDGDTPNYQREKIRSRLPHILITTPDMLHMGILSYHNKWREFFKNLRYVVVDELHTYKGVFGSHILHVFKRFNRVCQHYGSSPQFIAASATIANAGELAEQLFGRSFEVILESGAPGRGKYFLFLNPTFRSPYTDAADLMVRTLKAGLKTIVFTKARKITELIYTWILQAHPELRDKISSYRAGFLPEERREIEQKLFRGELFGVISTSALEMGIDIGGLDCCILVGYPGSIVSTWQRSGRVGRGSHEALIVMIALPDALDQYFMHHPNDFFARDYEKAIVDPDNEIIVKSHLLCAAAELPIRAEEAVYQDENTRQALSDLVKEGKLLQSEPEVQWFSASKNPHRQVDIRSIGESYSILSAKDGRIVGYVSGGRVFSECHEGSIYLHRAQQYRVIKLDVAGKNIYVEPVNVDYFTKALGEKGTKILNCEQSKSIANFFIREGRLKVTERITGYEKRRIFGQDVLSTHPLDLPPHSFETRGFWIEIEDSLVDMVKQRLLHFMGGIHAVEHTAISLFPLFAICDRNDIGGISYAYHPDVGKSAIFIYDGYPGGIGLTRRGYEMIDELLDCTLCVIKECPCEEGCPSCIQSPKCGNGNKPLDKRAAVLILQVLTLKQKKEMPWGGEGMRSLGGEVVRSRNYQAMEDNPSLPTPPHHPTTPSPQLFSPPRIVYLDIETQRSAEEVGGWKNKHLMGLAIAAIYDSLDDQFYLYTEAQVPQLIEKLKKADRVVGFNIKNFDYEVLQAYTPFDFNQLPTLDILDEIYKKLKFRLSLGDLCEKTLNRGKLGDGLQSVQWFKEGRLDKVIEYCRWDVELTRDLFRFGVEKGYLLYQDKEARLIRLPVEWTEGPGR
jgi:DEAD/DEAH box helicase domain-containing protein